MTLTPTPPTTTKPTGGGGNSRLTVSLLPKAEAALEEASRITGERKTDCINRALLLYAMAHQIQEAGGRLYMRETPGGGFTALRVL